MSNSLLLIDLGSVFYAVWHAVPPSEPAGRPHDVTVDRVRRMAEGRRSHVAVCADSPRNWRYELLPSYKANRESKTEACIAQLRRVVETLRLDGFPVWQCDGFEADDIIATATREARAAGLLVTIATADKDLLQLVCDGVSVHSVTTGLDVGPPEVLAKFGVKPDQLGDWLALVGDKADNVAGVPGIGPVKATALLTEWGYLANVMQAAADDAASAAAAAERGEVVEAPRLEPKLRAKLLEHAETLGLARKLVALRSDAPIDLTEALSERVAMSLPSANAASALEESRDMSETEQEQDQSEYADPPRQERPALPQPANQVQPPPQQSRAITTLDTPGQVLAVAPPPGTDPWATALEPTSAGQAFKMAKALHDARLFPNLDSPERIFAAMMLGRAHGVMVIPICQQVHVISGKLTLHATVIEGLVLKSKHCKYFHCVNSTAKSATYETLRIGAPSPTRLTYTIEEAEAAGLLSNAQYKKRPAVMLRHRCATDLARMGYPDVVGGLYTPDELGVDIDENGRMAA